MIDCPGIVFVAGLGAPGYLRPWAERTRGWAEVEVLDLPGWRGGRASRCEASVEGIAGAVIARLADRDASGVVLVGHSTAAQSAALVAQRAADRLAGVVLAGPTFDPSMRGWPGLIGRALRTARYEAPAELPAVVPKYVQGGVLPVLKLLRDGMREGARVYRPVRVPVLVLAGEHDFLAPPSWADRLARRLGADQAVVPGGHNFCFTHPDAADSAVRAAVARWSAASAD